MNETKELILKELGNIARLVPEQRMGQIIVNYICCKCPNQDPFYTEDREVLAILQNVSKVIEKKQKERELKKLLEEDPDLIDKIYKMLNK